MSELCDCPRRDHIGSTDGHCNLPSIRSEEVSDSEVDFSRWSQCGCCMADCPDVHPTPTPGFFDGGTVIVAAEHVATLPAAEQAKLRAQEAAGEIQIRPRAEMGPGSAG